MGLCSGSEVDLQATMQRSQRRSPNGLEENVIDELGVAVVNDGKRGRQQCFQTYRTKRSRGEGQALGVGGLRIVGIPTSERSAKQARDGGIELTDFGHHTRLDLTIDGADEIAREAEQYISRSWLPWSVGERPRRRSIALYQKLFEVVQLSELGGAEQAIEIVWGIGLSRWIKDGAVIDLPLIERLVEIEIDERAAGTIRRTRSGAL